MILSYTTAYQMLNRLKDLQPGMSCLVNAAGGAVGTALLEVGAMMGLRIYGAASRATRQLVRRFGATPIDYRSEDFEAVIRRETAGKGVDIVFDTIGGANWARSYRCVGRAGLRAVQEALKVLADADSKVPDGIRERLLLVPEWGSVTAVRTTAWLRHLIARRAAQTVAQRGKTGEPDKTGMSGVWRKLFETASELLDAHGLGHSVGTSHHDKGRFALHWVW